MATVPDASAPNTSTDVLIGVLDALDAGVVLLDAEGRVRLWNAWMERTARRPAADLLGRELMAVFPDLRGSRIDAAIEDALTTGAPAVLSHTLNRFPFALLRPDGRPVVHNTTVRRIAVGGVPMCVVEITDVTLQVERERYLRERREARYRAVVDTAQDAIVTTDVAGSIQWLNRAAERQFGYTADAAVGLPIATVLGEGAARWLEPAGAGPVSAGPFEVAGRRRDGGVVDLEMSVARWTAEGSNVFITGILRDITERTRARAELQRALDQKSLLLREVNHRVKNSLHLVSSLLSLQLRGITEDRLRHHFRDAISRIHAIAQVHARLYQTERFETVELATYLHALADDLLAASGGATACDLRIDAEEVELPIDLAIPLSLVANELITNAIKHGAGGRVRVDVSLRRVGRELEFSVTDDGPGLPADFDPERAKSLGLRIVTTLTRQVGGTLHMDPTPRGARFRIAVPLAEETVEAATG
ncbi:MAG TPA: PAS domain S-box protein [Azospirillum sp.]|nr:PAS domain S-box protein [Azospirillum sp.]